MRMVYKNFTEVNSSEPAKHVQYWSLLAYFIYNLYKKIKLRTNYHYLNTIFIDRHTPPLSYIIYNLVSYHNNEFNFCYKFVLLVLLLIQ